MVTISSADDALQIIALATELRTNGGTAEDSLVLLRQAVLFAAHGLAQRVTHEELDETFHDAVEQANAERLIQLARDLFKEATPRCWREVILLADALALRADVLRLPSAIGDAPAQREKAIGAALQSAQRALRRQRWRAAHITLTDLLALVPDCAEARSLLASLPDDDTPRTAHSQTAGPVQPPAPADLDLGPPLDVWGQITIDEPTAPARPEGPQRRVDLAAVLGSNGPIARLLGGRYHERPGQLEMAAAILDAMQKKQPVLIEAGTGSGKSFAYLVPAIWSGRRVMVATANKLLQDQLWLKDIPALQQAAPRPFTAALLKGRGNYICNRKLDQMAKRPSAAHTRAGFNAQRFLTWARSDDGELDALEVPAALRPDLTIESHECLGSHCNLFKQCFYERAKRRMEAADVAVINHSLLALNLNSENAFFTVPGVVVVDEAHELAQYTATALQLTLTYAKLNGVLNSHHTTFYLPGELRSQLQRANNQLFTLLSHDAPAGAVGRWALPGEQPTIAEVAHLLETCADHLHRIKAPYTTEELNAEFHHFVDYLNLLQIELRMMAAAEPPGRVRFVEMSAEGERSGSTLSSLMVVQRPLEVGGFLQKNLFDKVPTVVCTSATLRTAGGYAYFRQQVGAPTDCRTLDVPSPFDYPNQVLIYVAPHLVPPAGGQPEEAYLLELAREVYRLVTYSGGRALVLCTSYSRMRYVYDTTSPHLPYPLLCQGDAPRAELIRQFQTVGNAVLFATRSFWQGIDIPGEALSLVIIDRLPFPVPSDPVVAGREQLVRAEGGVPFRDLMLPEATLALKQGIGRLMRSETDRGVIALLDSRLLHKSYGHEVLAALPPARVTAQRGEVKAFFARPA